MPKTDFKMWRLARGLTCAQVAKKLGVHVITVRNWDLGRFKPRGLSRSRISTCYPGCPI